MRNLCPYFSIFKQTAYGNLSSLSSGTKCSTPDLLGSSNLFFSTIDNVIASLNGFQDDKTLFNAHEVKEKEIVDIHFDDIISSLILFFKSGAIMSACLNDDCIADVQTVGFIENGVSSVNWSPDGENILVADSNSCLFLLSSAYFEILKQVELHSSSEGEQVQVNVGWGKKETQFHGSEGKAAALKKGETVDPRLINDDRQLYFSWKGDGSLFAVSYWDHTQDKRFIKIFNKAGVLQCCNEDLPGIEGPIAWKPSGDLIAFSQILPNKYEISFLEKNGLKHGSFVLPSNVKVKGLKWNNESTILLITIEEKDKEGESLLLWTTGNYHWYQKQKISLPSPLAKLLWDDIVGNKLYGICRNGFMFSHSWNFKVNSSREWFCQGEYAYVAVIDNDKILLTSFKEAIIPPPMSQWTIDCPSTVHSVIFPSWNECRSEDEKKNVLTAFLSDRTMAIVSRENDNPAIIKKLSVPDLGDSQKCSGVSLFIDHSVWISPNSYLVCTSKDGLKSVLHQLEVSDDQVIVRWTKELDFMVISLKFYNGKALLQGTDGVLSFFNCENQETTPAFSLPEPCHSVEFNSLGIYSLSEKHRLYQGGKQIAGNVTSFLIHKKFLISTTTQHTLVIFEVSHDTCVELSSRALERGSKLVTSVENSVVLQLPRGNLETIQPRALSVTTAGRLLDANRYAEAVALLRKQRIDLNLCVDHNPKAFLENVDGFVSQVDPQWITLLVTELKSEDVTKTIFKAFYQQSDQPPGLTSKLSDVCLALRRAMTSNDKTKYILPILSTLVKTKSMEEAFQLADSDSSLQHLMFLMDGDRLYNEALAVYNLEAALKIAGKSQKDPKEYLPYLNSLREMNPAYMKYTIDKSLNKPMSALHHLAKCDGDDMFIECIQLVKDYSLYTEALKVFRKNENKYKMIADLYGEYLNNLKLFEEAGIMFKKGGKPRKAIEPFLKIGLWRECIILADECGFSDTEKESLLQTLRGVLKSTQKYQDAATLCLEILNDPQQSIEMFLMGKAWKEAIYTARTRGLKHLLDTIIKTSISDYSESLIEEIRSNHCNFKTHFNRLKVVRESKSSVNEFGELVESWETQSETSSVSSFRSDKSSTSRSSKNTRKASRKVWSLKEGNPREKQALIFTISNLIKSTEKLTGDVRTTCAAMIELGLDEGAFLLQKEMKTTLSEIEAGKQEIWPKDPDADEISIMDEQLKYPPLSMILTDWELESLKS